MNKKITLYIILIKIKVVWTQIYDSKDLKNHRLEEEIKIKVKMSITLQTLQIIMQQNKKLMI